VTTDSPAENPDLPEPVQRALKAYKHERLNCAQSVLRGFQHLCGIPEEHVVQAKSSGGGRAAEGRCGALHAAITIAGASLRAADLTAEFAVKAGSLYCREIRAKKKLTCAQCVELAATLLDKYQRQSCDNGATSPS